MRRFAFTITAVAFLAASAGVVTPAAGAQNPLDVLKRAAEDAAKKADAVKRIADSTRRATDSTKRALSGAKASTAAAKTSVEDAAKSLSTPSSELKAQSSEPSERTAQSSARRPTDLRPGSPAGASASSSGAQQSSRSGVKVEEQVLVMGEPGLQYEVSPRGQHLAAVSLRGSRMVMVYDGVDGPRFDEIMLTPGAASGRVVFSEDGSRYAYVGRVGQEWIVMLDGKELARGTPWNQSTGQPAVESIGFTPGNKHLYFTTFYSDGMNPVGRLYIDGKPGPASDEPIRPLFSPEGEHHAYGIVVRNQTGNRAHGIIIDGKPSPYPGGEPQFTTDGQHVFTRAPAPGSQGIDLFADGKPFMRASGATLHMAPSGPGVLAVVWTPFQNGRRISFVTVGNRRVQGSDCGGSGGIDKIYFSPDAKHFAVRCQDASNAYWVMADGKKGRDYQSILSGVQFTADGRPVYTAMMNQKHFVIVGDEEYGPYMNVLIGLARDRRNAVNPEMQSAVVAGNRVGFIAFPAMQSGNDRVVVVDGKAIAAQAASELTFSSDGLRYAYLMGMQRQEIAVDGQAMAGWPALEMVSRVNQAKFLFSPDAKYVAYPAYTESNNQPRGVAINGKYVPTTTSSNYALLFSPDSKHLMWVGPKPGAPDQLVYVDGEPVLEVANTPGLMNEPQVYSSVSADGVFTIIAQHGGAMKRFRITPGTGSVDAMLSRAAPPR